MAIHHERAAGIAQKTSPQVTWDHVEKPSPETLEEFLAP
jgi:hypothetical protein